MSDRAAHAVHEDGRTFALALAGDNVEYAIEVEEPNLNDLGDQVNEAILAGDEDLADWLTEELAYGRAQVIGAYFEVDA